MPNVGPTAWRKRVGSHAGGDPVVGLCSARQKLHAQHAGQRHAHKTGGQPDDKLIAKQKRYQRRKRATDGPVIWKYVADMAEREMLPADHAGNRADVLSHAPTLIARRSR